MFDDEVFVFTPRGEVISLPAGSTTIVDSRTQAEKAMHLPSVHGSLTYMESDIPCLIDVA